MDSWWQRGVGLTRLERVPARPGDGAVRVHHARGPATEALPYAPVGSALRGPPNTHRGGEGLSSYGNGRNNYCDTRQMMFFNRISLLLYTSSIFREVSY